MSRDMLVEIIRSRALAGLCSSHLTLLEIDMVWSGILRSGVITSRKNPRVHICCSISSLFPMPRRLHCRRENICNKIPEYPASDEDKDEDKDDAEDDTEDDTKDVTK